MSTVQSFTHTIWVSQSDIDRQGHVNNVAFVRYVQDIALSHWEVIAPAELRKAFMWVVRRHEIEYLRPGLPGDELRVKTWVGEPSGATWERFTEIHRVNEDRPLVTARTVWVLLDTATGRPRRVDPSFIAAFNSGNQPQKCD